MKKIIYLVPVFTAAFIFSCNPLPKKVSVYTQDTSIIKNDSVQLPPPQNLSANKYLITEKTFGLVDSSFNIKKLRQTFGAENIIDEKEYGAEGQDSFMVTKVFNNTPKEMVISWHPAQTGGKIASVESRQDSGVYYTSDSLHAGLSTLSELVKANAKPIKFYGTGWDYGGLISSYNNGKFQNSNISFSLKELPGMDKKLMGDHELNTDMPLVKKNLTKIAIASIVLQLK